MDATAIIGAGFGDEGKGLLTDYFAAQPEVKNPVVVRFNGGAQAGHTVVLPDGGRHIHGHFGSGTLAGVPTYLAPQYVVSPIVFAEEMKELTTLGISPNVYVSGQCRVTTPFDIFINEEIEKARGANRHGSCGYGFGETIERDAHCLITVMDLLDRAELRDKLYFIQQKYLPARLRQLNIEHVLEDSPIMSPNIVLRFEHQCDDFVCSVSQVDPAFFRRAGHIIFEGAQGLLLDQNSMYFPNVTRSNTGLDNVMDLAEDMGLEDLDVIYVTRAYRTRHGAGDLDYELFCKPYEGVADETNVDNDYQGSLRYAYLDINELRDAINADFSRFNLPLGLRKHLAITCLDHLNEGLIYRQGDDVHVKKVMEACIDIVKHVGAASLFASRGPTRNDVTIYMPASQDRAMKAHLN